MGMGRLEDRVALITGAARGQGREHALAMAREGADIVAVDICDQIETVPYPLALPQELEQIVSDVEGLGRRALASRADVRSHEQLVEAVDQAFAVFGRVDVLVVNHGIWNRGAVWEITEDEWSDVLEVNLTGAWRVLRATLPRMIDQGTGGSVILIASVNGIEGQPGAAHYTASKHGVLGLMRSSALELAPHGIRCNAICPGFVDTTMTDWQGAYDMTAGHEGGTREEHERNARHWHAIGGLQSPSSISGSVVYLASDDASPITGVALPVDAGHLVLPGFNPDPA